LENNTTGCRKLSVHRQLQGHLTCDVDIGVEGPQKIVATIALLHHEGRHRNGYQGLRRQMEDSSPHPRHTYKDNKRGDRAGRNTTLGSPSAQETKDGTDKNKANKRWDN
jgi:hypothetical protein